MSGDVHWGLGDCIRGLFATLEFAASINVRVSVDMTNHCVESFLLYQTPCDVRKRVPKIGTVKAFFAERSIKEALAAATGPVVRLRTNQFPVLDPSEQAKAFVRGLLMVRPEWRIHAPTNQYTLLHARIGDECMLNTMTEMSEIPEFVYRMVKDATDTDLKQSCIFISDCSAVLPLVRQTFPSILVVGDDKMNESRFRASPGHVGLQKDHGRAATTIRDMQLICGASKIVTTTCYTWISGFIVWLAAAFNVPVKSFNHVPKQPGLVSVAPIDVLRRDFAPRPRISTGGRTFVTFCAGSDDYYAAGLELSRQALKSGLFSRVVCYTDMDLQADVKFWRRHGKFIASNKRGFGYWLWKPFIINQELAGMADDAELLYLDAGCRIDLSQIARLDAVFRQLPSTPLLTAQNTAKHTIGKWTKRDLLTFFDADVVDVHQRTQQQAGAILMRKCARVTACVAEWWQVCSQNPSLIDDSPSRVTEHAFFRENRHDQSVWNLCLLKHGFYDNVLPCHSLGDSNNEAIHYIRKRHGH